MGRIEEHWGGEAILLATIVEMGGRDVLDAFADAYSVLDDKRVRRMRKVWEDWIAFCYMEGKSWQQPCFEDVEVFLGTYPKRYQRRVADALVVLLTLAPRGDAKVVEALREAKLK